MGDCVIVHHRVPRPSLHPAILPTLPRSLACCLSLRCHFFPFATSTYIYFDVFIFFFQTHTNLRAVPTKAYAAIIKGGKFTWNQFWNYGSNWIDCPDPMVTQQNCAADIRSLCNASSMSQKYAMLYAFSPGCHGSTSNITTPVQDIANFLLVRGPHAWLGHGWSGCSKVYERPKELDGDYGVSAAERASVRARVCLCARVCLSV